MIGRSLLTPTYQGVPQAVTADGFPEWKSIGATIDWTKVAAAAAGGAFGSAAAPTLTTATTGGFIPGGTYYAQFTYVSAYGESLGSAEATIVVPTTTATNTITITPAAVAPAGAVVTRGYLSAVSGYESFAGQAAATGGSSSPVTLTNLPRTGQAAPPAIDMSGSADGSIIWPDGVRVAPGMKGLRYGQVMCLASNHLYGPFDPTASDGRQTLVAGQCGIINTSRLQVGPLGFEPFDMDHTGLVVGGKVFIGNIIQSGTAAHSLAAGPTLAELFAVMPRLLPVYDA